MATNRDEFSEKTKKILQERVGNKCSKCHCLTSGPNYNPEKATRIGVAAHITAAAENGPRFDPQLSPQERSSILNGIWLCQNCAKLIDADPLQYGVGYLERIKSRAEELTRLELEGGKLAPEDKFEGYFCPHCDSFCKKGVSVCLGCDSDIYYGSTPTDWNNDVQSGRVIGLLLSALIFFVIPNFIENVTHIKIPDFWGVNIFIVLILTLGISAVGGLWFARKCDESKKDKPPVFVRQRH